VSVEGVGWKAVWMSLLPGLLTGAAGGALFAGLVSPWPAYAATRAYLAQTGRLPWPLMDFLEDAHRRGVLRQAGAMYQFRHIDLQRQLAARYQPPPLRWWQLPATHRRRKLEH
jgi:hypothetical protein